MKSLETLIKLQKTRIDEQQLILARLNLRLTEIENAQAQLEISKAREQVAAGEQGAAVPTYGAFLKAAVHQTRELEKMRQAAAAEVEKARDVLMELFEEQKRYEIAQAARDAAAEKDANRRETAIMDETGSVMHQRQKEK